MLMMYFIIPQCGVRLPDLLEISELLGSARFDGGVQRTTIASIGIDPESAPTVLPTARALRRFNLPGAHLLRHPLKATLAVQARSLSNRAGGKRSLAHPPCHERR